MNRLARADPVRLAQPVGLADLVFRILAILGPVAIAALAVNLLADPAAPGLIGQGLLLRIWIGLIVAPVILLVGALGVWRRPGNRVGRLLVLIALGAIAAEYDIDLGAPIPTALAVELVVLLNAGLVGPSLAYLMLVFPTGQVYPPRWTPIVIVAALLKFSGVLLEILATPGRIKIFAPTINPLFVPALAPAQPILAGTIGITGLLLPALLLAGVVSLVLRYRASAAPERQLIKWVAWGFGLLVPMGVTTFGLIFVFGFERLPSPLLYAVMAVAPLLLLASIAIAILRYHLFDIDLLINRTLVYGSLTLIVVSLYVLVVGALSEWIHASGSVLLSLVATGLIAVSFQPLRERLQRAVNRLMYGERDDPYTVLSRLGRRLEATLAPERVLPTLVETVAQVLKLPYVAIALRTGGDPAEIVASCGQRTGPAVHLPLVYQSETIGELWVAPRGPGEAFTPAELRLLTDIARQAGVAAHAVRLTADLQRSRGRLVTAREEERRRLRRDLHDGLGPALAAHTLKVGSARALLGSEDVTAAKALLVELEQDIAAALTDIRRLVYDLRPPALDELGLAGALRESAARYSSAELSIEVEAPDRLPALPAAVEVAVYRITQEALANVVRHAGARHCVVSLTLAEAVCLEIRDDGQGLPANYRQGVGLASMRERAEELGGTWAISSVPEGGTQIKVRLPMTQEA